MTPGVYPNISHDAYHADPCPVPSLAAGIADALVNQTPMHAWTRHRKLNPGYVEKNDTKFDVGTAAHSLFLEGIDRMEVVPYDDWRTNAAKSQREEARMRGKIPILEKNQPKILRMVEAAAVKFRECEDLAGYKMHEGMAEHTIVWTEGDDDSYAMALHADGGSTDLNHLVRPKIWLRCRPDWMPKDRKIMMDAKFTDTSASPHAFANQIVNMAYDLRASFYLRGNAATGGPEDAKYIFLVQETEPPYATSIIGLPPAFIALGDDKVEQAIAIWRKCMSENRWPAYPSRICWVEPPAWAATQWIERTSDSHGIPYDPAKLFEGMER